MRDDRHGDGTLPAPWGRYDLEPEEERSVEMGPGGGAGSTPLRLRRTRGELWLSRDDGEEWDRWAVPEGMEGVSLAPVFPDRSLVVRPERTFHLVHDARVRIYVRVPLHVQVQLSVTGDRTVALTELPTVRLSDTWFGDFMEGQLAYHLTTEAGRDLRDGPIAPYEAACPLQLSNHAADNLEVKSILLRVEHLSLFMKESRFWSDESKVRYRGAAVGSEVRVSGRPPAEARGATSIAPPRVPVSRRFTARTFARLSNLPGMAGMG